MDNGRWKEWDGLMVDEMNRMDFGLWTQQKWSGGKIM